VLMHVVCVVVYRDVVSGNTSLWLVAPASFGKLFLSLHAQSSVPQRLDSNALSSTISPKSWGN